VCSPERELASLLKAAVPPPLREDATPRRPPSHRAAPAPWVPAAASPKPRAGPSQFATPPRALAPKELPSLSTFPHRPEPRRRRDSSGCRCGVPPPATAGRTSRPNKRPNQTLVVPRSSPHPSPAKNRGEPPEFWPAAPATAPRGRHCKSRNLSRALFAKR
jgi:hypothetical protein